MKRFITYVVTSLFAFNFGITASAVWPWSSHSIEKPASRVDVPAVPEIPPTAPDIDIPPTHSEIVFGGGRLTLVAEEVQLKSERLRYEVDVKYPQIKGADALHIQRLNRRIKELAAREYQWPLSPSKQDLLHFQKTHPEAFNTIDLDYEVILATDPILSIFFQGYSYGIGAAHAVEYSFTVNYDLVSGKELKLSDLFAPRSNHLQTVSRYCTDELSTREDGKFMLKESVAPVAANFKSWNITRNGIRFNFDECTVFACANGEQVVEIPFANLKSSLSPWALSILRISSVVGL
jgi:hypothetical protein